MEASLYGNFCHLRNVELLIHKYVATFDKSIQSFCVEALIVDGKCVHLKNAVRYQYKKEGLTVVLVWFIWCRY